MERGGWGEYEKVFVRKTESFFFFLFNNCFFRDFLNYSLSSHVDSPAEEEGGGEDGNEDMGNPGTKRCDVHSCNEGAKKESGSAPLVIYPASPNTIPSLDLKDVQSEIRTRGGGVMK